MSAYVNEQLTIKEGLFQKSHVTPAARAKWVQRLAARWGLRPLDGTRGKAARFRMADVLRAEERAAR